jgi:hypothetical protein
VRHTPAAERDKAPIVVVAQDERIGKEKLDTRIAVTPGSIEPLKCRIGAMEDARGCEEGAF